MLAVQPVCGASVRTVVGQEAYAGFRITVSAYDLFQIHLLMPNINHTIKSN